MKGTSRMPDIDIVERLEKWYNAGGVVPEVREAAETITALRQGFCIVTGHECGSDTKVQGQWCRCVNCSRVAEITALREQEKALRQEVIALEKVYNRAVELGLDPPAFEPVTALRRERSRRWWES